MGKKTEQSQKVYNEMAWEYDSAPEGRYTRPHKEEIIKKAALRDGDNILDKTTPRLIQFHTFKNAANPPFLGGFSIFSIVAA